jgi:hypothetical protein
VHVGFVRHEIFPAASERYKGGFACGLHRFAFDSQMKVTQLIAQVKLLFRRKKANPATRNPNFPGG